MSFYNGPSRAAQVPCPAGRQARPILTTIAHPSTCNKPPLRLENRQYRAAGLRISRTAPTGLAKPSSGSADPTAFVYEPLGIGQIRLISVQVDQDGGISARMIKTLLGSPIEYVAISYAWGDFGDTHDLQINHRVIKVPANLYLALRALSATHPAGMFIWADALCIDQKNMNERNEQVQRMTDIYRNAKYVAVWLGPLQKGDQLAQDFLRRLFLSERYLEVLQTASREVLTTVACLFSRAYWSRLWVVQELHNARTVHMYYGDLVDTWHIFHYASMVFQSDAGKQILNKLLPLSSGGDPLPQVSQDHLSCAQVLIYHGPRGVLDRSTACDDDDDSAKPDYQIFQQLLEMMQLSRRKKVSDPRDRVLAIRGALPERIRREIQVDYNMTLKDIYIDVFALIADKTHRLDVMCESIHFPLYRGIVDLPSWVPDWSHTPMVSSLAAKHAEVFHADGDTRAEYRFDDGRRNRIKIKAVALGTIEKHGTALNTGCRANDYIRAFEGWRLELMNHVQPTSPDTEDQAAWDGKEEQLKAWVATEEEFCETLSFGQATKDTCYPIFAAMIRARYPYQPLDAELKRYADSKGATTHADRQFLQDHFGENMMGRCFCITSEGTLGLGSGFLCCGDMVVVALGCRTPLLLRSHGTTEEGEPVYRFVGEVYLHGYMTGKAVREEVRMRHEFLIQ